MTRVPLAVTPAAPPTLLRRAIAPAPDDGATQRITTRDAGWRYVEFVAHSLGRGQGFHRSPDEQEVAVIVQEGAARVRVGRTAFGSVGSRTGVFEGPPAPVVLAQPGQELEVSAESDAAVLVASAPGGEVRRTALVDPGSMRVEHRGEGSTARTVHHLLSPDAEAGRLILVEVFTPGGNWSSYPPHKHDTEDQPRESYLEELYYYRFARTQGFAFARVYTADRALDESMAPGDGDVVLVPRGYHPVGMPAGYDGYYLNVMAGPTRLWHFTLDPDHAWLMNWDPAAPR
jgi:5-deoxy-glucuronate isomerase